MKNNFIIFFILLSASVCAQTPETKFLKKSTITWAAYSSDTVRFSSPNLSLLIRQLADAGKIKVAAPNIDKHIYIDNLMPQDQLRSGGLTQEVPFYDSLGNLLPKEERSSDLFSPLAFDDSNKDLLYAEQFLYLDNKRLRSHVSWLSPTKRIVTTQGVYLGDSYIFNAYHNTSEKISKRTRRKAIPLGITSKIISDSLMNGEMIKQWFGETFSSALFHTLNSDGIEIYNIDSARQIKYEELDNVRLDDYELELPKYNIFGELMGSSIQRRTLDPKVFTKAIIIQQWFYDPKKQIVFNDVKEIILFAKKLKNGELESTPSPILRIVYR